MLGMLCQPFSIVDDNLEFLASAEAMLAEEGFDVVWPRV